MGGPAEAAPPGRNKGDHRAPPQQNATQRERGGEVAERSGPPNPNQAAVWLWLRRLGLSVACRAPNAPPLLPPSLALRRLSSFHLFSLLLLLRPIHQASPHLVASTPAVSRPRPRILHHAVLSQLLLRLPAACLSRLHLSAFRCRGLFRGGLRVAGVFGVGLKLGGFWVFSMSRLMLFGEGVGRRSFFTDMLACPSASSFNGGSTHGCSCLLEAANLTNSVSFKRTARGNRVSLVARSMGPVESDSLTGNGVGVGDFDADPLSLNEVSSQNNGSKSAQNGDLVLAAVDMGTNSFHMVVVRADKQGRFQLMDTEKEDVRLGSGSPDLSVITPDSEERALAALKRFKILAQTRKADMRVVATSAVREARNRRTFVRRVLDSVGLEVEVLAGTEEACLIYQGVLQALPVYDKTVLVVDIGGGSTEFVLGNAGKPIYATSLKLGHIRLSEQFLALGQSKKEELKKEQIEELRRHIRVILADSGVIDKVQATPFEIAIGSSGTIESIEQMIHHTVTTSTDSQVLDGQQATNSLRDREFTADELNQAVKKICKAKTVEQRAKIPGLPEKRADVIVGGAVLLEEIFLAMGIKKMKVSPYALREGVIVDTLAKTFSTYKPGLNIRSSSILNLATKFNTDRRMESAQHSALLAKEILTGLQTCRSGSTDCVSDVALLLNNDDAELLEAATILHYVGMFINHKSYHKHSHYLIKNNEHLLGYSPMEIEILALLARYHRKKVPSQKDEDFASLPDEVQKKVRAMCAVMRVAVALDRCDSSAIQHVHVFQQSETILLAVVPAIDPATGHAQDVSLEVWAAQQELPYFVKIFKRKVSIIVADERDLDALSTETRSVSLSS